MTPSSTALVETSDGFVDLITRLRASPVVGIDTEAASFHRYADRVYLLQLSSRDETAVVDPIAIGNLDPLPALLEDPEVEVVFHDADYDLRLLYHEFRFRVSRLFDTRVAAQFVNEPGVGLGTLLERYFGVQTDKRFQRADWSARPLSAPMLEYAATDTRHLPALRDTLRDELEGRGRLEWVAEECELLTGVEWPAPIPPESAFLRMKGARTLDRRGLAVLRELYVWRDGLAARLDRALFRVMANGVLLSLATRQPQTPRDLANHKGVGRELMAKRSDEILAAIHDGLAVPESDLPRFTRNRRPPPDPALDARLERLKRVRASLAESLELDPGVLCPKATLEAIARAVPDSLEALGRVPGVRRWQVGAFGTELVGALTQT